MCMYEHEICILTELFFKRSRSSFSTSWSSLAATKAFCCKIPHIHMLSHAKFVHNDWKNKQIKHHQKSTISNIWESHTVQSVFGSLFFHHHPTCVFVCLIFSALYHYSGPSASKPNFNLLHLYFSWIRHLTHFFFKERMKRKRKLHNLLCWFISHFTFS